MWMHLFWQTTALSRFLDLWPELSRSMVYSSLYGMTWGSSLLWNVQRPILMFLQICLFVVHHFVLLKLNFHIGLYAKCLSVPKEMLSEGPSGPEGPCCLLRRCFRPDLEHNISKEEYHPSQESGSPTKSSHVPWAPRALLEDSHTQAEHLWAT